MIKQLNLNARLAGWCRAVKKDIDSAIDLDFEEVRISHPVSHIHFKAKWADMTDDELLDSVTEIVEYAAKDHGLRVFVHGEDSTRTDWGFEKRFIDSVAEAGAECYRICDTVGTGLSDVDAPLPNGIPDKMKVTSAKPRSRTSKSTHTMISGTPLKTLLQLLEPPPASGTGCT